LFDLTPRAPTDGTHSPALSALTEIDPGDSVSHSSKDFGHPSDVFLQDRFEADMIEQNVRDCADFEDYI